MVKTAKKMPKKSSKKGSGRGSGYAVNVMQRTASDIGRTAERTVDSMAMTVRGRRRPTMEIAIISLILNIIVPGLGSIIGGKTKQGIWQVILLVIGTILSVIGIGIFMILIAWIWALVSGIHLIMDANR